MSSFNGAVQESPGRGAGPFPCGGGGNADGWPETRPAGTTRDSLAPIPPALGLRQPLRAGPGAITIAQRRPPPPDGPRRGRHAWPPFGRLRGPQCDKRPESRHPGAAACSPKPAIPGNAAAAAAAAAAGDPGAAVEGHRPAALPVRREGGGGRGYMKEGVTEHEGGAGTGGAGQGGTRVVNIRANPPVKRVVYREHAGALPRGHSRGLRVWLARDWPRVAPVPARGPGVVEVAAFTTIPALSAGLSVCLSVCLSACLPACHSVCLCLSLCLCLSRVAVCLSRQPLSISLCLAQSLLNLSPTGSRQILVGGSSPVTAYPTPLPDIHFTPAPQGWHKPPPIII